MYHFPPGVALSPSKAVGGIHKGTVLLQGYLVFWEGALTLYFSVRQGLNKGQKLSTKMRASHSSSATLGSRLHEFYYGGSLFVVLRAANRTGSSRPGDDCLERTEAERRTRSIVPDASKRSNGLSRKRVPSSGEYSCLIVPTLPNSNHQKRQNHTAKILATE